MDIYFALVIGLDGVGLGWTRRRTFLNARIRLNLLCVAITKFSNVVAHLLMLQFSTILDATRFSDGMVTCIKRIEVKPKNDPESDSSDEIEIAKFLSSPALSHNDSNHCVTVIDSFQDPMKLDEYYMVMPMLRTFDEPEFGAIGEVVDFVGQILEVSVIRSIFVIIIESC